MRLYRIVMRSGTNVDVVATAMVDDPSNSEVFFFSDEAGNHLAATVRREEIAGLILGPQKASAISQRP
jgi:hypothetical protein